VDFYIVSDDQQGRKNTLVVNKTPDIPYTYTPTEGAVIPARSGWFSAEFKWPANGSFQADSFASQKIFVGSQLVVGGAPSSFNGPNGQNGQVAVLDGSGKLVAWMGQSEPGTGQAGQGTQPGVYGGWFGNLYVGGTNPLDAPIWIDQQGIVEVGGIAAAQPSFKYPYISVRDASGYEKGRIGAQLTVPSGPTDGIGTPPPPGSPLLQLTAGAWFTQLAVGGSNISNWNILVVPDPNNSLGSQLQIRNVNLFEIDYAAQFGSPANNAYRLQFGNSVWSTGHTQGSWQFPGISLYEIDNVGNQFGAVYLSRGVVLQGHGNQNYPVLVSLVTYNGQPSGADLPNAAFWGELDMFSPLSPYNRTVYLASGSASGPSSDGSSVFVLSDKDANMNFQVNQRGDTFIRGVLQGVPTGTPVNAVAYNVNGYGPVIDAAGNWKGKPISGGGGSGSQTPWTQDINAAGFNLLFATKVQFNQALQGANVVINSNGAFVGYGIDVSLEGISCGYLSTLGNAGHGSGTGQIDCHHLHSNGNIVTGPVSLAAAASLPGTGWLAADYIGAQVDLGAVQIHVHGSLAINSSCQFVGNGVNVGGNEIICGHLECDAVPNVSDGIVSAQGVGAQQWVSAGEYRDYNRNVIINNQNVFVGNGVVLDPHYGMQCGYLNVLSTGGGNGQITCGSVSCTGQINAAALSVSGNFSAAQYLMSNGTVVINTGGGFVGHGVDVRTEGIGCGYLEVRANYIVCPEIYVTYQGGNGFVHCTQLIAAQWVVCNGWAVSDPNHNVYFAQLFANSWSGSQPVIASNGWFTGAGVNVGNQPVNCGSLNVGVPPTWGGTITCGPINGGNASFGAVNCYNCSTSYGGYYAHGGNAAYFFDDRGNPNATWGWYSQSGVSYLWYSLQPGGNVYVFTTTGMGAPSYYIGVGLNQQVINSAGQFIGAGVAVGGSGVGCGGVNVLGGGVNAVPYEQWTGKTYRIHLQTFVSGVGWCITYALPYPGFNGAQDGLFFVGGTLGGIAGIDGAPGLLAEPAGWNLPPDGPPGTPKQAPLYSGPLTLKDGTVLTVQNGRILAPAAKLKGEIDGKVISTGSERDEPASTARSGADKRLGHDRRVVARYGTGQKKPGNRFRASTRLYSAGVVGKGRRTLRQRPVAKRSPVSDPTGQPNGSR
jgi:hypothetical protein